MISERCFLLWLLSVTPAWAQLNALSEDDLRAHAGQGGMYLTGEFSVNRDGGVLWSKPNSNDPLTWAADQRSCAPTGATVVQSCGVRVAVRTQATGGWYVVDNLKGTYSFEGLTIKTRLINSGFGSDGASFNKDVLEVGLPSEIEVKDGAAGFAIANQESWRNNTSGAAGADTTFRQTNLFSVAFNGTLRVQGNVLIFPR